MDRQKYGEYTLDLRGLGEGTLITSHETIINSILSKDDMEILSQNLINDKKINVILPEINLAFEDELHLDSFGQSKYICSEYSVSILTFFRGILQDDNDSSLYVVECYIYKGGSNFILGIDTTPIS